MVNANKYMGIYLNNCSDVVIIDSFLMRNGDTGIHCTDFSNVTIEGTNIYRNYNTGIGVSSYSNITIKNSTISCNGHEGPVPDWPIETTGISAISSYVMIEDSYLENNRGSVHLQDNSQGIIRNNIICEDCLYPFPGAEWHGRNYGIRLDNSMAVITDNDILECAPGIKLLSSNGTISGNTFLIPSENPSGKPGDLVGINVTGSTNTVISNNTIYNRLLGIHLDGVTNITLDNNTIESSDIGIWLNGSCNNTISDNTVYLSNYEGIMLDEASNNTIIKNIIYSCKHGVLLCNSSDNNIERNTIGGLHHTIVNETVHGPATGGETGPIYLDNGNIADCSLYADVEGEWCPLAEGPDYTLNYTTGEIDTSNIEPYEAGWIFYAWYNYSTESNVYGIYSVRSSPEIIDNTISYNDEAGIYIDNQGDYSLEPNIEGNILTGSNQGIEVVDSFVTVTDNVITKSKDSGIVLERSSAEISLNTIRDNHRSWVHPSPDEDFTGIKVRNCDEVWIHNNSISENRCNVYVYNSTDVIIEFNTITDGTAIPYVYPTPPPIRGIYSVDSQAIIANNIIWDTMRGIDIMNADQNTIVAGNTFNRLTTLRHEYGLYLNNASILVERNTFNAVHTGIYAVHTNNSLITNNTFNENMYYSLWLIDCHYNHIFHNAFFDTDIGDSQAFDDCINFWNAAYPVGGNYWSDYTGMDLFSGVKQNEFGNDGFGDTPYLIAGSGCLSYYPLMVPP